MRVFRRTSIFIIAALAVAACGSASGSSSAGSSAGSSAKTDVRIVATFIDSIPAMASLKVADARGYFRDAGLNLTFASAIGGGDTLRPLTTGDADIAIGSPAASTLAVEQNPNLKIAAIWLPYNPFYFAGVKPLTGLNGTKLGGSVGASTVNLLINGLNQEMSANFVSVKAGTGSMADDWAAVKAGDLQASWVMQPFLSQIAGADHAIVDIDAAKYIPDYPADFVVVNKTFALAHAAAIRSFFIAVQRIFSEFPDQAKQAALGADLAKVMVFPASVIDHYLSTDGTTRLSKTYSLKMNANVLQNISNLLQASKLITGPVNWSQVVDQSYLPTADRLGSLP
jgi:NitT/TauT family transport system substrate-binding protein